MKILSISAQKPDSTGSGIYLTELVRELKKMGHEQAVIAGIGPADSASLPDGVEFYPVRFETEELPFPVVGMSDEMPYKSTRYRDMTDTMTEAFIHAFVKKTKEAVEMFEPDLILCHHLYLMTAAVRRAFPEKTIYGFCHNTDLRQMQKTDLRREYIKEGIRKLDRIFVAEKEQIQSVVQIYGADARKIRQAGNGYNSSIFKRFNFKKEDGAVRIIFAGKISEKKGVVNLINCIDKVDTGGKKLTLFLAGGAGNEEEYRKINDLAGTCRTDIIFLGKLPQTELAEAYNKCDIFVLPSYFDSIPLTFIEALACGLKVVITDLPGLRQWAGENIKGGEIRYVPMPEMKHADEPREDSLPLFEKNLAQAISDSIKSGSFSAADLSAVSWQAVAEKVLG